MFNILSYKFKTIRFKPRDHEVGIKTLNLWLTGPKGATRATDCQIAVREDNVISITLLLFY